MLWILTTTALLAFAANSLLCRLALASGQIDPVSFTALRLLSGMLILIPVARLVQEPQPSQHWKNVGAAGITLFIYAITFSLGYVSIGSGMGTLLLAGAVQVTMLSRAVMLREPISKFKWLGSAVSFAGLIYLVLPGITAPDPKGAIFMMIAGTAWGLYSIYGRGARAPVLMTSRNFICASAVVLLMIAFRFQSMELTLRGAVIAIFSGAVTSALGYVVWYRALRHLSTSTASIVQLVIPVLAAIGGILLLDETVTLRLITASTLILGGVLFSFRKQKPSDPPPAAATPADARS